MISGRSKSYSVPLKPTIPLNAWLTFSEDAVFAQALGSFYFEFHGPFP
jgi:hypothetical protein